MCQHWNKLLDNTKIINMEWSCVLVYPIYALQCLHAIVEHNLHTKKTSKILVFKVIRYTIMNVPVHWTLYCLWVISSVYYSWNLLWHSGCVLLGWSGSWSVIQDHSHGSSKEPMNPWPERFISSFDNDPDNPKEMHPLSLLNFLLNKTSR